MCSTIPSNVVPELSMLRKIVHANRCENVGADSDGCNTLSSSRMNCLKAFCPENKGLFWRPV